MKIFNILRRTRYEKRYNSKMGELTTKVTYIKKCIFGMPYKTLHKYRETYYGEVKDCADCVLFV